MTPIDITTLLKAGYRLYGSTLDGKLYGSSYVCTMQKPFDDDEGRRYTIVINCINLSEIADTSGLLDKGYIATVQFHVSKQNSKDDYTTFNIEPILDSDSSIEEMEEFFNNIWHNMKCKYHVEWSG